MAPRKALSSLQGCIIEAVLGALQLQSCSQDPAPLNQAHQQLSPFWHSWKQTFQHPSDFALSPVPAQLTTVLQNNRLLFPCLHSQSLQCTEGWWRFSKASTVIWREAPWLERHWRAATESYNSVTLKSEAWWLLSLFPPRWRGNSLGVSKAQFCLITLSDRFKALFAHKHCTN